jgi:hypothetical protein
MGWMIKGSEFKSWYEQDFSSLHVIQTSSGGYPLSYPMGTGDFFLRGKATEV